MRGEWERTEEKGVAKWGETQSDGGRVQGGVH